MNEVELGEAMSPDHPDYDYLGSLIPKVFMAVLMGRDIEMAMDELGVPAEHRDYVRKKLWKCRGNYK